MAFDKASSHALSESIRGFHAFAFLISNKNNAFDRLNFDYASIEIYPIKGNTYCSFLACYIFLVVLL